MRAKIVVAFVVLAALAALLVVSLHEAKRRATLTHCRNNLRKLGEMAIENQDFQGQKWDGICRGFEAEFGRPCDFPEEGRGFWQRLKIYRFLVKRQGRSVFDVIPMNMFDCPVNGPNPAPPESIDSIDYRGPAHSKPLSYRTNIKEELLYKKEPFAADRPGNHPGGSGFVLMMDLSVHDGVDDWGVHDVIDASEPWTRASKSTQD